MDEGDCHFEFARRRLALNVWVRMIGAMQATVTAADDERYQSVTGRQCLLTGLDLRARPCPATVRSEKVGAQVFFVFYPESKEIRLIVCPASQICSHYRMAEEKKSTALLRLDKVTTSAYFFGRREPQHGGYDWRESHCLRYLSYLIPLSFDLDNSVVFPHCVNVAVVKKCAIGSGKMSALECWRNRRDHPEARDQVE